MSWLTWRWSNWVWYIQFWANHCLETEDKICFFSFLFNAENILSCFQSLGFDVSGWQSPSLRNLAWISWGAINNLNDCFFFSSGLEVDELSSSFEILFLVAIIYFDLLSWFLPFGFRFWPYNVVLHYDRGIDNQVGILDFRFPVIWRDIFSLILCTRYHPSERASRMIGSFTYLLLQRPFI